MNDLNPKQIEERKEKRIFTIIIVFLSALFLITTNYYYPFSLDFYEDDDDSEPEPEPQTNIPEPEPEPQRNNSTAKVFVGSLAVIALGSYILIFHPGEAKGHYRKTAKSARKSYKKYKWW